MGKVIMAAMAGCCILLAGFYGYGFQVMAYPSIIGEDKLIGMTFSSGLMFRDRMSWMKVSDSNAIIAKCQRILTLREDINNDGYTFFWRSGVWAGIHREITVVVVNVRNEGEAVKMRNGLGSSSDEIRVGDIVVYEVNTICSLPVKAIKSWIGNVL